jgi:hypothetical protein
MSSRVELVFRRPLTPAQKLAVQLALGPMAKVKRIAFPRGDFSAVVIGEGLSPRRIEESVRAEQLPLDFVRTSLAEEPEPAAGEGRERLRPIGR